MPAAKPVPPPRTIYSVNELNELLRALIEDSLPSLWVQGEISNLAKPASGHWYFTLKDAQAQIRCAMFRNANYYVRPVPANGDQVLVRAKAGVYPARGELQLIVEHLEPAGVGALLRAFEELKARLAAEGLFDAALKRSIPARPARIGLITSATGAAVHDVLTTLQRRWPLAEVWLHPVPVQGVEAPPAIVKALSALPATTAARGKKLDVILLVRGGGSLEDLWAFNDEKVARAIRACAVPVVSGVGHEVDVTIADFVADLRAATPTAAAECVTPDIADDRAGLMHVQARLARALNRELARARQTLANTEHRLHRASPTRKLQDWAQRLDELSSRLQHATPQRLERFHSRLNYAEQSLHRHAPTRQLPLLEARISTLDQRLALAAQRHLTHHNQRLVTAQTLLASLNPNAVLQRGYAIVSDDQGQILRDVQQLKPFDYINAQLANGRVRAEVRGITKRLPEPKKQL